MFCERCGADNPAGTRFCAVCGEPCETAAPAEARGKLGAVADRALAFVKEPKNRTVLILAAAAATTALVLAIVLLAGRGWKSTVRAAVESCCEADGELYVGLFPDGYYRSQKKKDDAADAWVERYEDFADDVDDYKVEIKNRKELSDSKLEDLQELYMDEADIRVKDALEVRARVAIEGKRDFKADVRFLLVKVGASWYLHSYDIEDTEDEFFGYGFGY